MLVIRYMRSEYYVPKVPCAAAIQYNISHFSCVILSMILCHTVGILLITDNACLLIFVLLCYPVVPFGLFLVLILQCLAIITEFTVFPLKGGSVVVSVIVVMRCLDLRLLHQVASKGLRFSCRFLIDREVDLRLLLFMSGCVN